MARVNSTAHTTLPRLPTPTRPLTRPVLHPPACPLRQPVGAPAPASSSRHLLAALPPAFTSPTWAPAAGSRDFPSTPTLLCCPLLYSGQDEPHSHSVASHCPPGKSELHPALQSPKCTCHQGPPASLACPLHICHFRVLSQHHFGWLPLPSALGKP